jgi:hypothetical protein
VSPGAPRPPASRPPERGRALLRAAADPLAWILALAGFFDGISDNWLHALLLMGAAVAVWADAWLTATGRPTVDAPPLLTGDRVHGRRRSRVVAVCAVAVAYAVVVGGFARYTWPPTVAVLLPGAVALVVAWHGPVYDRREPAAVSRATVVAWTTVLVAAGAWELSALLLQPDLRLGSPDHPTVSFMMDTVLAGHLGRTVTLLAWLALGWWLLGLAPARQRSGQVAEEVDAGSAAADPAGEGAR